MTSTGREKKNDSIVILCCSLPVITVFNEPFHKNVEILINVLIDIQKTYVSLALYLYSLAENQRMNSHSKNKLDNI